MPLADYEHHNEEALAIWWAEEGRFAMTGEDEPDDADLDVYYDDRDEEDADDGHSGA